MEKNKLLAALPPFKNNSVLLHDDQSVNDIVNEVLQSHEIFKNDYDTIAESFYSPDIYTICQNLFNFCKSNIYYKIETEKRQTSRSPSATLAMGNGDCKHYAGFIAGVLDAMNRQGEKIKWYYRFASYNYGDREPQHVFVVVKDGKKEIWIDPVLDTFNQRQPIPDYYFDEKPSTMALHRLSGIADYDYQFIGPVDIQPDDKLFWRNGYWHIQKNRNGNIGQIELLAASMLQSQTPGGGSQSSGGVTQGLSLLSSLLTGWLQPNSHRAAQKIFEMFPVPDPPTAENLLELINAINAHWQVDKATADSEWTNAYADALRQYANAYKIVSSGGAMPQIVVPPEGQLSPTALPPGVPVASGNSSIPVYDHSGIPTSSGIMDWIKQNPLLAAGAGFLIYKFAFHNK